MAASFIRVRLHFDYAPPAVVGCRMCWLLVDLRCCRVVADLEGMIRDRFDLSPGSVLRLFIEDCYLPHTESILLVRDNDCVRVQVDSISKTSTQTSPEAASGSKSKRHRPAEDPTEAGATLEFKKKKRKKSCVVESPAVTVLPEPEKMLAKTQKKKKKEKESKRTPPASANALSNVKKSTKSPLKPKQKPKSSSSSSSSSSEDEQPVKKTPKSVSKPAPTKAQATPKPLTNGGPALKKLPRPSSSSSSDTDSTSEDEKAAKSAKPKPQTEVSATTTNGTNGNEEEEIELVIKKPLQHPKGRIMLGQQQQQWQRPGGRGRGRGEGGGAGRGEGRGRGERPGPREEGGSAGRGRGRCVQYDYNEKERAKRPAAYGEDQLHNVSVVLQNGSESLPRPDYSTMPLLAGPPQVGQKIAFKLLELTENYTPEVSGYKEGRILGFDPSTKQIELKLLTSSQAPVEPGKFDLVYQNADGSESVEYAVDRGSLVTERWDSLLEPRLVL